MWGIKQSKIKKTITAAAFSAVLCLLVPCAYGVWYWPWGDVDNPDVGNGISVDTPKVFDDLSLIAMADQLSATLAQINGINPSQIIQNIGLLQGSQQEGVSRSFSLSTLPTPSVQLTDIFNTNLNQLQPSQKVISYGGYTPSAPSAPSITLPGVSQTGFGSSAEDILSEQMNLSYQILNLQLLLERSMSDRIYEDEHHHGQRPQALLGFQVSIDPLDQHEGEAAIVQITLYRVTGGPPTLVSLMPQAKTYNEAALSQSATEFGASAVVKVVTLGYNEEHQAENYYLYRDSDTVAFERQPDGSSLTFGWEFRPVLGRKTVEAGLRQLFAVVSLNDLDDAKSSDDFPMKAVIKTYWVKFDSKNDTIDSGPRGTIYKSPVPLDINVPTAKIIQDSLGPQIENVDVNTVGQSNVLINITGNNFYAGTEALLGDKVFSSPDDGLIIKSDHVLQIQALSSDLANGRAVILGRYGSAVDIIDPKIVPDSFAINTAIEFPLTSVNNPVPFYILKRGGNGYVDTKGKPLILSIGSQTFYVQPQDWQKKDLKKVQRLATILPINRENLQSNTLVRALFPFTKTAPETFTIYNPVSIDSITVVSDDGKQAEWGVIGKGFDGEGLLSDAQTKIVAGDVYTPNGANKFKLVSPSLITFDLTSKLASTVSNVVVQIGQTPTVVLAAPKYVPTPKVSLSPTALTVSVGTAPLVTFNGSGFQQVTNISFDCTNLDFYQESNGTLLHVYLNRDVTSKAGAVALPVKSKDGSTQPANLLIQ